ncbi:MAG TPA: hypothetical protein PKZ76_04155 [Xanthomonadaceae bacterium]|nr:hypothetical protein [Xanthomonadaceae bacterium]
MSTPDAVRAAGPGRSIPLRQQFGCGGGGLGVPPPDHDSATARRPQPLATPGILFAIA